MVIKALAARDTVAYFVGTFQEPTHLRYALGPVRASSAIAPEARTPSRKTPFTTHRIT